jgi:hypothetical protein
VLPSSRLCRASCCCVRLALLGTAVPCVSCPCTRRVGAQEISSAHFTGAAVGAKIDQRAGGEREPPAPESTVDKQLPLPQRGASQLCRHGERGCAAAAEVGSRAEQRPLSACPVTWSWSVDEGSAGWRRRSAGARRRQPKKVIQALRRSRRPQSARTARNHCILGKTSGRRAPSLVVRDVFVEDVAGRKK